MNPAGECSDRYKNSIITAYLYRAYKTCTTQNLLNQEIFRIKQILINNGFSNRQVDSEVRKFKIKQTSETDAPEIKIYYENQMSNSYKVDERMIKGIINRNVKTNNHERLRLIIYYKNSKTRNLIIRNNTLTSNNNYLQSANVIYKFSCPYEDCALLHNVNYIGMTTNKLSKRLQQHSYSGAPKEHFRLFHGVKITKEILENNVEILEKINNRTKLYIGEALLIEKFRPSINIQDMGFTKTLKLYN